MNENVILKGMCEMTCHQPSLMTSKKIIMTSNKIFVTYSKYDAHIHTYKYANNNELMTKNQV